MDSSTTPAFPVTPGGLQQLSPFQTEKAKYFFRVNLDLENKGFVTWEDVEFYILFHMTVAGREDDAQLESLLHQKTKAVWNIILDNWPDADKGRITSDQFLDTWASLVKFIQSEDKLPQWLDDWIAAGFKLYDVKGDGRIRPGVFHALYSKMGLRIMSSTAAYHALMDAVNGPLTLEAVLMLTRRLIISSDPSDLSGFLMPGFEVKLSSGQGEPLLRPNVGAETAGKASITNPGPPATEETNMQPPTQEANGAPHVNMPKFPTRSNNLQEHPSVSSLPRSKKPLQPAAETKTSGSKPIPVLSKNTGQGCVSRPTASPNVQQSCGHSIKSDDASRGAKFSSATQDVKQSVRRCADKHDRGLICKILRDMNINPSECEILIDENNIDVRPAEMYRVDNSLNANLGDNRWRPVVQVASGQVRTQQAKPQLPPQRPAYDSQYMFRQQRPNMHIRHRLPGPRYPLAGPYNFGIPTQRPYSSIPGSLENISRLTANEFRTNGYSKFRGGPGFQQATSMAPPPGHHHRRWMGRPPVDDALVEEVVRKAVPLIQRVVRDEVKKYTGLPGQSHTVAPVGGASGTAKAGMFAEQGQSKDWREHKRMDKPSERTRDRPAFPKQPDEYEFNGSIKRANAQPSEGASAFSSRLEKHQDGSMHTAASSMKGRSDSGSPTVTASYAENKNSDADEFWRGESGQSPSVNKMVFDRLLKRQQEMRAAHKPETGNGADDVPGEIDKSDSDTRSKLSRKADGDEAASDNTLEDEMLFIPGLGAYPPFVSMGVDPGFLQGSPMGGMGFAAPPFMMAMGGPMFPVQTNEFSSDMENTPPGMDGVFIVIDDKSGNVRDAPPKTAGNANL